ncbi:argininosuccinate lyase [Entomophthora muscae]|uniref:Argininosuccinate lyase n=1 Tax=Entomophthora muscae TaxID=34485 RepID=A0ACC2SK46_9FUNG|nr:argininosuccinate lyase [Entomophthora muscae]
MTHNEDSAPQTTRLWGGRFSAKSDPIMDEFNKSIHYDRRLFKVDIVGSQAYARALKCKGILSEEEEATIINGLDQVRAEWENGTFKIMPADEDIHSANERRLSEIIGPTGGKLHTGRSRNDQVATDTRLWLREQCEKLEADMRKMIDLFVQRAEDDSDIIFPGYTHLQRAQPIRWSHWLLNYAWRFKADAERLTQLKERFNLLPLGSGALAGNPFELDRLAMAKELGFAGVIQNSLVGVSDRDFIIEFLFWASMTMLHVSQISEDLILWSTAEFGFVQLHECYTTGSSLMPQKKNPDSLELLRGKSGRVFGKLAGFMMTVKGLPSSYNKDMQEDKEPLFDAADTLDSCISLMGSIIHTLTIHPENMKNALSEDMLATDMADYLVRKGVPFRETHHVVGQAVLRSEEQEVPLSQLPLATLKELHPQFESDIASLRGDFAGSADRRNAIGGTSLTQVKSQIQNLREWLKN